jgi:hypothetical protein
VTGFRSRSLGPLSLVCLAALSCGGSRQLQSVTVQPSQADAKNFTNGQVQFTATGIFTNSSMPVTLTNKDISWCYGGVASSATLTAGMCAGNVAQLVSIDSNGVAQCNSGFQGMGLILAGVPIPATMPDVGQQLKVYGSATLTCP